MVGGVHQMILGVVSMVVAVVVVAAVVMVVVVGHLGDQSFVVCSHIICIILSKVVGIVPNFTCFSFVHHSSSHRLAFICFLARSQGDFTLVNKTPYFPLYL